MQLNLSRTQPDFENWAVVLNGELQCHDQIVSADAITGVVVKERATNDNPDGEPEQETLTGIVTILERNEAVKAKEPKSAKTRQFGLEPEGGADSGDAPADEAEVSETDAPRKHTTVRVKPK